MKKLIILLAVVAFGCKQGGGPITQADKDAIQAKIDAFVEATRNNTDPSSVYAGDAVSMPPHHGSISGASDIGDFHNDPDEAQTTAFTVTTNEIEGSGDIAFVTGTWSFEGMANDTLAVSDQGSYTQIYKRQEDQSWRIYREIWNSDEPMSEDE